jgi:hypothetical protein
VVTSVSKTLIAGASGIALLAGLAGCATNPLDAAACTAFITAQNVYDDTANNALKDNNPVNSGLWTAAWKALPTAVTGAAKLADGDALKKAFAAYTEVLDTNENAAEAKRLEIWSAGYAQTVMSVCVSSGGAKADDLTPINVP